MLVFVLASVLLPLLVPMPILLVLMLLLVLVFRLVFLELVGGADHALSQHHAFVWGVAFQDGKGWGRELCRSQRGRDGELEGQGGGDGGGFDGWGGREDLWAIN